MKLIKYFNSFLKNEVNLNQGRLDLLGDRTEAISTYLKLETHDVGPMVVRTVPQGSYAHGTIIKPVGDSDEFDADLLLELEEDADWEAEDYVEALYRAFRASPTYKYMVSRRSRCVVVNYVGDFHVDVVPYLERHEEHYITNRNENRFELTNPEGYNAWLDDKDRITERRLVKVIRLVKYLRDYKNTFSVKSFILSLLLAGRVNDALLLGDPKHYSDVPTALKNILSSLNDYLQANLDMPLLVDPSCPSENFNHRWNQDEYANFRTKLKFYSDKVTAAYNEEDKLKSLALWQEVFGSSFKAPTAETKAAALTGSTQSAALRSEQWLDKTYGIPTALDPRYRVTMIGRVQPKRGFRQYDLPSQGNMTKKGRDLVFSIRDCSVPMPYKIYWKIRNYGSEAEAAEQLRGDIHQDDGSGRRRESTSYRGRHYVDCYIVKDGVCVARSRQPVIVT